MKFKKHSEVEGRHALLSASKYHWLNDDPEKLIARVSKANNAVLGTRLHQFAVDAISLGRKQPNNSQTLNLYINDCIGYRMETEVVLFYSWYAFGTADAIQFRKEFREDTGEEVFVLRIFDLKTGTSPASVVQLQAYAALFCLEYDVKPMVIDFDLRIYQNDEVTMFETDPEDIARIMDRYVEANKLVTAYQEEV